MLGPWPIGISDVVAEDHLTQPSAPSAARTSVASLARSRGRVPHGSGAAGFADASVRFTHQSDGMHSAIIQAQSRVTATSKETMIMSTKPLSCRCVHNDGRSQMAAGYLTTLSAAPSKSVRWQ